MSRPPGVVLVQYSVGDDETIVFIAHRGDSSPRASRIPISEERLRVAITHSLEQCRKRPLSEERQVFDPLLRELVQPILDDDRIQAGDVLWIVPHSILHAVPFHGIEWSEGSVSKRHPVVYTPSASVMKFCRSHRKEGELRTALVVSDTRSDLSFARREAASVARMFNAVTHRGADATLAVIREEIATRGHMLDILHLACHGFFNAEDPMRSGVVLHGGGVLTADDLMQSAIHADLIAVTACESGMTEVQAGDEVFGLSRALLLAGTASLLLTSWKVDDYSTALFTNTFYREWTARRASGEPAAKARAFQRAQERVRESTIRDILDDLAVAVGEEDDEEQRIRLHAYAAEISIVAKDHARAAEIYRQIAHSLSVIASPSAAALRRSVTQRLPLLAAAARIPTETDYDRKPFASPYYWAPFVLMGDWA